MQAEQSTSIAENLHMVKEKIRQAAKRAGRSESEIDLVAVSKFASAEKIIEAYDSGQRFFGESRVQESQAKIESLSERLPAAKWLLVGHLQSNKASKAVELFDQVQSIDSFKIASRLNERVNEAGHSLEVLLEINSSGEEQKYGVSFAEAPSLADEIAALEGIRLTGLMTIGPHTDDEATIRGAFARTKKLFDSLASLFVASQTMGRQGQLSMGMSSDFELAIAEGASEIRIGTAIFGPRGTK